MRNEESAYLFIMKNKIILVVSSLFLLASCGTNTNVTASSIDVATATTVLKKAMEAETASDALGIKASASFAASVDISIPAEMIGAKDSVALEADAGSSSADPITSIKANAALSDVSVEAMASGLSATSLSDLKASVVASGSAAFNVEGVSASAITGDYANMKVAAYLDNGNVYADASNATFIQFGNFIDSLLSSNPTTASAGKYLYPNVVSAKSLPVFSEKVKAQVTSGVTETMDQLASYKDYFQTVSYSDGTFGLNASLKKNDLVSLVALIAAKSAGSSNVAGGAASTAALIIQFLNVNACDLKITFNEKGLISSSFDLDIGVDTTFGEIYKSIAGASVEVPSAYASLSEKVALAFKYNVSFLQGKDVVVAFPNTSEYASGTSSAPLAA